MIDRLGDVDFSKFVSNISEVMVFAHAVLTHDRLLMGLGPSVPNHIVVQHPHTFIKNLYSQVNVLTASKLTLLSSSSCDFYQLDQHRVTVLGSLPFVASTPNELQG
jgi:hypothetical protein